MGFPDIEAANGHLQAFESFFPFGRDYDYTFLVAQGYQGLVLKADINKTHDIRPAANGRIYVRRGAQSLPVEDPEDIQRLRRNKGLTSFENEPVHVDKAFITNSETIIGFMLEVIPDAEPEAWLHKSLCLIGGMPSVSGIVLFADEPQALLPKRTGIKVYRYKTSLEEGTRETLDFTPISVEGCAYNLIRQAVETTTAIIQSVSVSTPQGLEKARYPNEALHEVITNAVLHRDYSVADDIHIKIFDNRIEVASPGTLPAHITPENILKERFSRNGTVVRLINKFPNPPNQDVGEGLNTAFNAMRAMKLRDPVVSQENNYVTVYLRHEELATPDELVMEYLESNASISNSEARAICFIGSENTMKRVFQRMMSSNLIERVPETTRYNARYRKKD